MTNYHDQSRSGSFGFFVFFPRVFLPRLGFSELFYWAACRHWDCFYTGQSPDVQSPKAKSIGKSGEVGGRIYFDMVAGMLLFLLLAQIAYTAC